MGYFTDRNGDIEGPKPVKVYPPPPSSRKVCKDPVAKVTESQLAELDPKGERKALFDYRRNPRSVKPGDIVRVTFKNGDPFNGVVLSIKLRGIDTSFLLRNELTRVAVEMSVKVFNPNVQSVEIVQRAERKPRRARLYYMRCVYLRVLTADIHGRLCLLLFSSQEAEARPPQCREYRGRLCPPEEGFPGWQQTAVERELAQSILHIWDVLLSVYIKFHHIITVEAVLEGALRTLLIFVGPFFEARFGQVDELASDSVQNY